MKVRYLSDLHVEHEDFEYQASDEDLIILAGDIHSGTKCLDWIAESLPRIPILYVLGNHEYYHHSFPYLYEYLVQINVHPHIHILNDKQISIDGVNFFGTTLWTDFNLFENKELSKSESQRFMNDYHCVTDSDSGETLTPSQTENTFYTSMTWLESRLSQHASQCNVVITHHAPSLKSIHPKYLSESVSAAFASNLDGFIKKHQPEIWVHGHVHTALDYQINKTRVLCNPRGYPEENVQGCFDPLASFTL